MPDLDATTLHLEVRLRFCGLLALDEKSGPLCDRTTEACEGLTPSRSLRNAKSLGFVRG
jgi:hypothetical protein